MTNAMNNSINTCEKLFKSGKITPLDFNFPSFSIDEKTFKYFTLDAVEEKFRQAQTSEGNYDLKILSTFTNPQDSRYSLEAQDITKKALTSALTTICQTTLSKLSNDNTAMALSTTFEQLGHLHDKEKFAASLLMIKNTFPDKNYLNRVMESLEIHEDQDLMKEIKKMVKNPDMNVVNHIYKLEPKMAMENFPQQSKEILNMEKPIMYGKHKLG